MLEDGEEVRAAWVAAAILWGGDVGGLRTWAMGLVVLWASPRLICTRQEQRDVFVAAKQAARAPFFFVNGSKLSAALLQRSMGQRMRLLVWALVDATVWGGRAGRVVAGGGNVAKSAARTAEQQAGRHNYVPL